MGKNKFHTEDPTAAQRKSDHIELAVKSRTGTGERDTRFYYEPFLSGHPDENQKMEMDFMGKHFDFPIWISSMTGGTKKAKIINENLAKIAGKFGLGMGLGSCRSLLNSDEYLKDFSVRKFIGDQALYANLGIAQVEELVFNKRIAKIGELIDKLDADGLIVHINPMQEFIQPEGDTILQNPLITLSELLEKLQTKIIIKEVGQGFGPESLKMMMQMPFEAIDFAAFGGTNFTTLELSRTTEMPRAQYRSLSFVGQSAEEMIGMVNNLGKELGDKVVCQHYIVSGGISNFLDGYYGINKIDFKSIYGMASGFLQFALKSYDFLEEQVEKHIEGLKVANAFLKVR